MKPISPSDEGDRKETIKYFDDLDLSTPFEVLGESYLEQLRAVLNYAPILTKRVVTDNTTTTNPISGVTNPIENAIVPVEPVLQNIYVLIEASTNIQTDVDIWAKQIGYIGNTVVGFLKSNSDENFLYWGGDDRESGKEQVLVDVSAIRKYYTTPNITIETKATIVKEKDSKDLEYGRHSKRPVTITATTIVADSFEANGFSFTFVNSQQIHTATKELTGGNDAVVTIDEANNVSITTANIEFTAPDSLLAIPCDYILFKIPNGRKEHKTMSLTAPCKNYEGEFWGTVHNNTNNLPLTTDTVMSFYNDGINVYGFVNIKYMQTFTPKLLNLGFTLSGYWNYFYEEASEEDSNNFTVQIEVYKGGALMIEQEYPRVIYGDMILQKTIELTSSYKPDSNFGMYDSGEEFIKFDIPVNTTNVDSIQITKIEESSR